MKINEQNSLRVLLLAIALTILGGATGIMFYATQQNEAVMASEQLAIKTNCKSGEKRINGKCVPIVVEPTEEEKCLAEGKVWDSETKLCEEIQREIVCADDESLVNGECAKKSKLCESNGGYWNEEAKKCIICESDETIVNGICVKKEQIECEQSGGIWNGGVCEHKCDEGMTYKDGACTPDCKENEEYIDGKCREIEKEDNDSADKEKAECEAKGDGWIWVEHSGCEPVEKRDDGDIDGDGIPNDEDDDMDGDGYLNDNDLDARQYNVGDRDILMFATLAYEPVSASIDMISGDSVTGNGKTVAENYYADSKNTSAPADIAGNGYPDYFDYICKEASSWNVAANGRNQCMIDEDRMIGMQAQSYNSEIGGLIGAWQTTNKDFYFGDDQGIEGGADLYQKNYEERGLDKNSYKGYASIDEVSQWVIVDHIAQRITSPDTNMPNLLKDEGVMQATVFRLKNNFVIAYRGTDFPDLMDWLSDLAYASNSIKGYEDAAQDYARGIVELYASEYYSNPDEYIKNYGGEPNFYITGHSLAGYLAPIGALGVIDSNTTGKEFLREVIGFNGMGVGLFGSGSGVAVLNGHRDNDFNKLFAWAQETDENGAMVHKVMTYNINGDPVSALGRHVNQTGYYSAEGAIVYHSTEHVALLQEATRTKLTEALLNAALWGNPIAKALGEHGEMYNRLDTAKDYMEYYSEVYGDLFKSSFNTTGALSAFDIFFFCHEPSASLFYNISQGVRGYPEKVAIKATHSGKTTTLTAEVNSDVESYSWYKNGELVGTGNTYSFATNELTNGTYSVSAVAKTRQSNKETIKETVTGEIKIDESAPSITVKTENGITNPRSGETINFIIRTSDASGFTDGALTLDEIEVSGSMLKKYLTIEEPVLLEESTDTMKVWRVSVKSSVAGALRLIVLDGAFSDISELKSKKADSQIINYTVFEHKQNDNTRPTVKILPENAYSAGKGNSLRIRIEGFDEEGIDAKNLKDKTSFTCSLGSAKLDWAGDIVVSDDGRTAYATAIVSCNDSSKIVSIGTLSVGIGAFVDKNNNKSLLKSSASLKDPIRFTAPADKTAPFVKITGNDGTKGMYGGSLTYTVTVNDESGLVIDTPLENNIDVFDGIRNGISITSVSEPKYNDNKTIASYTVVVSTNENCSKNIGCGGTFTIRAGAFKDTAGNSSLSRISGNIAFASERDIVPPIVKITPLGSRSAEEGETLSFKIVANDAGGIDTEKPLKEEDIIIVGKSNANVYIESLDGPKYNDAHTQAEYIVVIKGEDVASNIQINVKNGAVKDNAGNSSSSILSDIIMFIRRRDLTPPTVTIKPLTSWNAIKGNELKFVVTAKDDNKLSKNKSVDKSSFYMTKLLGNDATVTKVDPTPTYSAGDTQVSYTVTVYATKSGKSQLTVKPGVFRDSSNNLSIIKLSDTITFEDEKDTTPPRVSINYDPGKKVKQGNKIQLIVTLTDNVSLIKPTLKKEDIKVIGNNDIVVENVDPIYNTKTEISWRVTVKCGGTFGFGVLVKDAKLLLPKFQDGNNNKSATTYSDLIKFTKY